MRISARALGLALAVSLALAILPVAPALAGTLDLVRERGLLRCGIAPGPRGLATREGDRWQGFDVDFCRAFAAAVLGDAEKLEVRPLDPAERIAALVDGRVDVLARQASGGLAVGSDRQAADTALTFWDGQGFLVPVEQRLSIARELDGARICVEAGSAAEGHLEDFSRRGGLTFVPLRFVQEAEAAAAYFTGRCRALTAGRLALSFYRRSSELPEQHELLPDSISKEPMGPLVRADDRQWQGIIRWTSFALMDAEEKEVTSENAASLKRTSKDGGVRRLLGVSGDLGPALGLEPDWAYQAIVQVGNYGEIYRRHLGSDGGIGLERGPNALMMDGGLLQSMPFQ